VRIRIKLLYAQGEYQDTFRGEVMSDWNFLTDLLGLLFKQVSPTVAILLAVLILLLYFRKDVCGILGKTKDKSYDVSYLVYHARYAKRLTKQYTEASKRLEGHPLNVYSAFSVVQRNFRIRNVEGQIIDTRDRTVLMTSASAEHIVRLIEKDYSMQPLSSRIYLTEKIRKVVDLILIGIHIREMGADGGLQQAYCRLKQDRLRDLDLFRLYDYVTRDIVGNSENYGALQELSHVNKNYIVMILNSIERGILHGMY